MRSDRYRPDAPPYLLYGFLGISLVLNIFMALDLGPSEDPGVGALTSGVEDAVVAAAAPEDGTAAAAIASNSVVETIQPEVVAMDAMPGAKSGWALVRGEVDHSLARTFQTEVGDQADAVAAVYSRLFMWDLDLRKDLRRGDAVVATWRASDDGEIEIPVAWFKSQKLGRTLKAYRYQAPGDAYASYWFPDGTEVPLRLVAGPLDDYDQITSLLKDRPTHKGMDFKADVGTDVVSPKAGTVTRVNWNWKANGNCVEVRYADGTLAKFLHLDKVSVTEGQHVTSGQLLAKSGNTGRSTAPHLHYQLDRGSKNIDPLDYHDTIRRKLPASAMDDFNKEVARLDAMLGEPVAAR
ncbi:MAG: peptidoglycan DD-metalloendopeptidase family protein [Alphaproteobacteria bacterium]|nr:peptidoglycan DD-metalloendopeptidase family protein [Alphaproteobacteria bacterium]